MLYCSRIPQIDCAAPIATCEGAILAKCDASAQPFMPSDCVQGQSRSIPQKKFFPTPTSESLPTWAERDLPYRPRMPSEPLLVLYCVAASHRSIVPPPKNFPPPLTSVLPSGLNAAL